jgi:DnaK suppressor protein
MRKETLNRFKKMFVGEKQKLLFSDRILRDEFSVNADDRFDEIDQATTDVEQSMRMRLCNRETLYLKKVEDALQRIEDGTFGLCESCEEDLGKISNIKLFENNYYYELNKTRPYIRSLEFSYNDNKSNIAATLNSSKNEYSYYTSDKSIIKMVNASGTNISSYEIPRVYALYINQSKSTLLNQKDFRAKVANGISRSKIIQEALGGYAAEAYNPLPFDKAVMLNDSNVMASATSTASSTITLATLNSEELLKVSQNIKDQLANSGINVEIKSYDKDELVGKVIASRDFEMLLFGAEISDTSMLYPLWHSSFRKPPGSNISGYLSTTLDKNLEAIIATTSPSEIDRLYSEIKNEINSEYAWIPLYTTTITGFTPKQLIITNNHAFMQGLEGRLQYISKEYIKTEPLWRRLNTANSNKRSNIAEIIYNFIH